MADEPKAAPTPLTQDEIDALLSGPTIYSNKVYMSLDADGIRLTFCEHRPPGPPRFRSSVMLGFQQAMSLRDILVRNLEKVTVETVIEEEK